MSKIYEIRSIARGDAKLHGWGARHSRAEAEAVLSERSGGKNSAWAEQYHERWWIEEIDTTGLFEIPPAPPPRERFRTNTTVVQHDEACSSLLVDVLDQDGSVIATYARNHSSLYRTFEPFRQADRMLALISRDYTATSVMDLVTGKVIAEEEPSGSGFCPVGFYVPDWWDINDASILPGSTHWTPDRELPRGDFGFVWGCIWGDDASWKVQYLDLSRVQEGMLARDERFGRVELASHPKLDATDFIRCSFWKGERRVTFSVETTFNLDSGAEVP